jgi:putative SOS response-associated peptidase YedK
MCGRYGLNASPAKPRGRFKVPAVPELPFDGQLYNIAPSQQMPIVRQGKDGREMSWLVGA